MILRKTVKNHRTWGGVGGLCLAVSILLGRFGPEMPASDFIQGMLIGMSLVFNITFLILWRKHRTV